MKIQTQIREASVITNYNIAEKAAIADDVITRLMGLGVDVTVPMNAKGKLKGETVGFAQPHRLYDSVQMVFVIGGDGSILEAARRTSKKGTPILGINKGRLGYMSELEANELDLIEKAVRGEYRIDARSMLGAEVLSGERVLYVSRALNDAVISNGTIARLIDLQLYEDDVLVGNYRADGLLVTTPTGSTAYSLSAGGPILDPRLRGIGVTPICPHSFAARPLVFPDSAVLLIKNVCEREPNLYLTLDGKVNIQLGKNESVRLKVSNEVTNLVRVKDNGFYKNLYSKMNGI